MNELSVHRLVPSPVRPAVLGGALLLFSACGEDRSSEEASPETGDEVVDCGPHGSLHDGPGADPHCHCDDGYEEVELVCVPANGTGGHDTEGHATDGHAHDTEHHHDETGEPHHDTEDTGDTEAPACGGHGELHGDHCHCDSGYEAAADDPLACVPMADPTGERLVVADADAERLYVFEMGSWELVADFEDVVMDDHAGFLPLEDGRVLFYDSGVAGIRVADLAGETPTLGEVVPVEGTVAHLAVDPAQTYAVASATVGEGQGLFTLFSLADLGVHPIALPTGEPGVALGADPLALFHRNSDPAQFEMYPVANLLEDDLTAVDTVAIGAAPHGEVIAHAQGKIVSAADDGINVVSYGPEGFGDVVRVPYDVDGLTGGRAFYARLSGDGRYLYSYLRDAGPDGSTWGQWRSDAYVVDLEAETARRIEIGAGLVYRLGSCETWAAFTQYSPDGDALHLMDADASSATFQTIVAAVPLDPMIMAPGPEGDVWSAEAFRITAVSNDCRWAFVTHGGDGMISVVDIGSREVVRKLETPTSLAYGGYLLGVRPGMAVVDTIGR